MSQGDKRYILEKIKLDCLEQGKPEEAEGQARRL